MTLSLTLLGTPEIYLDDHLALRFRTHKAQALLIYLAVTNRSWTRDALATLFWPETDDATARKNLRDILPPLRRQLGDYLLIDEETIGLKLAGPLQCDVTHFQMLMEGQLQSLDIERLAETLKLYRGEFLEGYNGARISADFELWVLREREHVHQLALVGFTTLCRRQREAGAYGAALLTNRRLLELAPWDEASHRRQMQLLAQTGQEAAALAQFDACRTILAEELSVEPLPETVALYEEIRAGAFRTVRELGPLSRETAATNSTATTDVDVTTLHTAQNRILPNNLPAPLATFIGRHAELALIADRLTATNCRLLTILGPGGMGKSSLALAAGQQLLTAAQDIFPDGIFWVPLTELSAPLQHGTVQGISGTPAPLTI
ncbi:MAG: BTAD domain-containing putative transcriptional regulator [Caldilineaceae bacterium]